MQNFTLEFLLLLAEKRGPMATIKLNLQGKSLPEKLTQAQTAITDCTNNPNLSSANPAEVGNLNNARYTAQVKLAAQASAKQALKTATQEVKDAEAALDDRYAELGALVQDDTKGDAAKILTTGFAVASESNTPIAVTAPQDFSATPGDEAGEIHIHHAPMKGAQTFETQATTDLTGATGWGHSSFSKKSNSDVNGLAPGVMHALRCRAIGSDGPGPWSIVVLQRAA